MTSDKEDHGDEKDDLTYDIPSEHPGTETSVVPRVSGFHRKRPSFWQSTQNGKCTRRLFSEFFGISGPKRPAARRVPPCAVKTCRERKERESERERETEEERRGRDRTERAREDNTKREQREQRKGRE